MALDQFSAPTRAWFEQALGAPTPPQALGWPAIQRGEHTLILAPTGSGKTLAAFLWGIDQIQRRLLAGDAPPGVQLVYVSPLKALNNDVERNLRAPLEGIHAAGHAQGIHTPTVRVAVRTGDTPASARAAMTRQPPHILITTPESLYLLLTSARGREMFRTTRAVIVDEIHTLVGNKRGAHLALSLERLEAVARAPVQRIALSATVHPVEEAAAFLGGDRPVTVIDAKTPKALDLEVVTAVDDFSALPADSVWPSIVPSVLAEVYRNTTTLIFANNRRLAERTADRLNAQFNAERDETLPPGDIAALAPGGVTRDRGMFAIGAQGPFRAHHGSVSKEARRQLEEDLKAGKLPALVGTSSLELGIDIGSVGTVVQLQSPSSVSQGLQRVGRSGHLVGQTSRGRIYATHREDVVAAAAIARGMLDQDVEPTHVIENALDVLAQQIVAMVAVEPWPVRALFDLIRRARGYHALSERTFHAVLDMLSGAYFFDDASGKGAAALRPKIAWDKSRDELVALPGTRLLAMSNAGTISDRGQYTAWLADGKTKLGELDEEFVFETRPGDTFLLGSNVWRVTEIRDDRIVVSEAPGATPRMPFWRGEYAHRPYELGVRIERIRRAVVERLATDPAGVQAWLRTDYHLDARSAWNLVAHVQQQLDAIGALATDSTLIVEAFENDVGDPHVCVHSPFGGRVNGAWALALRDLLRERLGVTPEMQVGDDGILFRFAGDQRGQALDLATALTPDAARERLLRDLPDSAAFGAQFRMNAARALLLTKPGGVKRTPFWMQRMRAKDLLARVSGMGDFPIVVETYRDCLRDVFDLPRLEEILARINRGDMHIVTVETAVPSPTAAALLYRFTSNYLYEWDAPKAERALNALALPRAALAEVLAGTPLADLLKPEAVRDVAQRAARRDPSLRPRTPEELLFLLRELGDLEEAELAARAPEAPPWLSALAASERVRLVTVAGTQRWIPSELSAEYRAAFEDGDATARARALRRHLRHAGPVTVDALINRFAVPRPWLMETLDAWVADGSLVRGAITSRDRDEYCDVALFEQIHRRTLTILRKETQAVPRAAWSAFLLRWQHAHPATQLRGLEGTRAALGVLNGLVAPTAAWERDLLPTRVTGYGHELDDLRGEIVWAGAGSGNSRLFRRGEGGFFLSPFDPAGLEATAQALLDYLAAEGASYEVDLLRGLGVSAATLAAALRTLSDAGAITCDSFAPWRRGEGGDPDERPRAPVSALEAELAARLKGRSEVAMGGRLLRPSSTRMREARQRVSARLRVETLPLKIGDERWAMLHRAGVLGPLKDETARAEGLARALLARHGVLTREGVGREAVPWSWDQLFPLFERMEMRGELRRGYFVAGLSGAQFALPAAVEALREAAAQPDASVVVIAASDPACVYGGQGLDAPAFARVASTQVALMGGRPFVLFADHGERITVADGVDGDLVARALSVWLARPGAPRRVRVTQWNGVPVLGGPGEALLRAAGFSRAPLAMERG
ncbi:MAG: DEAD/DEAH box helicase [Thermoflexales bacterium]|nr:DEAD/DEAH box helicase [Thermoflexales bacterium]